jgi:hypothetical protein
MSEDWSQAEVELTVSDYLDMLTLECTTRSMLKQIIGERTRSHASEVSSTTLKWRPQNRSLGEAGEEFITRFEVARLASEGQERLAAKVERVSQTHGDAAGFDILSFESDGRERPVEVKTTRYGKYTPFFLSRNEVQTSDVYTHQYALYRLSNSANNPGSSFYRYRQNKLSPGSPIVRSRHRGTPRLRVIGALRPLAKLAFCLS